MSAEVEGESTTRRLTNACGECGDCYHPVIGPNTDGDPCDWCRDCGCASSFHSRIRVIPLAAAAEVTS